MISGQQRSNAFCDDGGGDLVVVEASFLVRRGDKKLKEGIPFLRPLFPSKWILAFHLHVSLSMVSPNTCMIRRSALELALVINDVNHACACKLFAAIDNQFFLACPVFRHAPSYGRISCTGEGELVDPRTQIAVVIYAGKMCTKYTSSTCK